MEELLVNNFIVLQLIFTLRNTIVAGSSKVRQAITRNLPDSQNYDKEHYYYYYYYSLDLDLSLSTLIFFASLPFTVSLEELVFKKNIFDA